MPEEQRLVLGDRIAGQRHRTRLSQVKLAKLAGVDSSYISKLEHGKIPNPTKDSIGKIADALAVPLASLWPDDDAPHFVTRDELEATVAEIRRHIAETLDTEVWEAVPVQVDGSASQSRHTVADEWIYWEVPRRLRGRPSRRQGIRVIGDCLKPDINSGDRVIVDPDIAWRPDQIIAIRVNGGVQVKRLVALGPPLVLKSNEGYITVDEEDSHIAGVVVWRQEAIPF